MGFSKIGDENEVTDKEKITLDRFMRLFEADCAKTGWNMTLKYENALLKKILHINDRITNAYDAAEMTRIVSTETAKLERLEDAQREMDLSGELFERMKKSRKRKKMDGEDEN